MAYDADECAWKAVERVEDTVLHAIGRIVQNLLNFCCGNLDYSSTLREPQTAIGCLFNSNDPSECSGIRRDDTLECFPVKESQPRFAAKPNMTPPPIDCPYSSDVRLLRGKNSLDDFILQEENCALLVSEPRAAHPIREG